jgi:hypothetical protein
MRSVRKRSETDEHRREAEPSYRVKGLDEERSLSLDPGSDRGDDEDSKVQLKAIDREPLPSIDQVLCIPDKRGNTTWKPFAALPHQLKVQLQTRFDADYADSEGHKRDLRRILENQARYLQSGRCINNTVYQKSGKEMPRATSDGKQHRACDYCVFKQRICAKLGHVNMDVEIAIYPLPANLREGKTWKDLEFWVQN